MPTRYALSPSALENVRRWKDGRMDRDELRRRFTEPYRETPLMAQGKAIHEALEKDLPPGGISYRGYAVTIAGADTPFPGGRELVAREEWVRRELDVRAHDAIVEMNCRLDGRLAEDAVLDYKTSRYAASRSLGYSAQWRTYCTFEDRPIFVGRHYRFLVERPLAADQAPHIFTDRPVDVVFDNDWELGDVVDLCAVAIGAARMLDCEQAVLSKRAKRGQLRFLGDLVRKNRPRAEALGIPSSYAALSELTVFQVGRLIDSMKAAASEGSPRA